MLEKFTVIDLIKTRSDSVCTVEKNYLKFNTQTAYELRFPPVVQFLIDAKGRQFAIQPCKEGSPNSTKFSKPEGEQKYPIRVSLPVVVDMLRKLMGWSVEDTWNLPGAYFAEDNAIIYSLEGAYAPQPKGGWAAKRKREEAAAAALDSADTESTDATCF